MPVLIYLAFNLGGSGASGWGAAMSTDTAFALGMLALVGRSCPDRLRVFVLTVVVVDDLVALLVIGTAYSHDVVYGYLALARRRSSSSCSCCARSRCTAASVYAALGAAMWLAVYESGVEPVIVGLVMGLLTYAYPATRLDLERATKLFRSFREQPTPELARTARQSLETSISPNERLQHLWHPWTSYADRAALRARERRDPDQRHAPPRVLRFAGHARDPRRLRRRQAGRDRRAQPGSSRGCGRACGCPSAGRRSSAAASSRGSASPSRC